METNNAIEISPYDTPFEISCMLINAKRKFTNVQETTFFEKEGLRRIGEHLINYCNVEREEAE